MIESLRSWWAEGPVTDEAWWRGLLGAPLRIAVVVIGGIVLRWVLHRLIGRLTERIAEGRGGLGKLDERLPSATAILAGPLVSARRGQRARTLGSVLKSIVTGLIGLVMLLMILGELDYNVAPLLASAGVAGVALGFGAQTLVKDVLSGIFMIMEDQYGVGDVVDLGEASGTVEAVGLRVTRIRDVEGTVWYVRNGEVLRVGNRSQGWARAVLDLSVSYSEDVDRVKALMLDVAVGLHADAEFGPKLIDEPEVWGIETLSPDGIVVRHVEKTQPREQWTVARELRERLKRRFDAEGVRRAVPQSQLWLHSDDEAAASPAGAPTVAGRAGAPGPGPARPATTAQAGPDGVPNEEAHVEVPRPDADR
ncbi:MAG: mechanosensitive ion channel family protein [Kineosporiaceae bacterium]